MNPWNQIQVFIHLHPIYQNDQPIHLQKYFRNLYFQQHSLSLDLILPTPKNKYKSIQADYFFSTPNACLIFFSIIPVLNLFKVKCSRFQCCLMKNVCSPLYQYEPPDTVALLHAYSFPLSKNITDHKNAK